MTVKTRAKARTSTNKSAAPRIATAIASTKSAPPKIATATASKSVTPKIAIATATASKKRAPAAQKSAVMPVKPLPWKKFKELGGRALSPEVIVAQLVGETVFPGFVLGKAADEQPTQGFEVGHEDDREVPTNHELVVDEPFEYRVRFLMVRDESYKEVGLAAFGALRDTLQSLLGKRTSGDARWCVWTLADREIDLQLSYSRGGRPEALVTLTLRAL